MTDFEGIEAIFFFRLGFSFVFLCIRLLHSSVKVELGLVDCKWIHMHLNISRQMDRVWNWSHVSDICGALTRSGKKTGSGTSVWLIGQWNKDSDGV